jgi:hypothetical protein
MLLMEVWIAPVRARRRHRSFLRTASLKRRLQPPNMKNGEPCRRRCTLNSSQIYVVLAMLAGCGLIAAIRAIAREGRRRRSEEREQLLREHPELAEIAAIKWRA